MHRINTKSACLGNCLGNYSRVDARMDRAADEVRDPRPRPRKVVLRPADRARSLRSMLGR